MCVVLLCLLLFVAAANGQECYGPGEVAGAAIGGFFGALLAVFAGYYLWRIYQNRRRRGKHLVLSTDPENVKDEFAFDNAGFQSERGYSHDATLPLGKKGLGFTARDEERPATKTVQLWARDFAGLGFTVEGGAREGIRVHSVLGAGPAAPAGVVPGDKIVSLHVSFAGCVLSDGVQLLSLASPYPVRLELEAAPPGWRKGSRGRQIGGDGAADTMEREERLVPPKSPNTSNSNNSTLETKAKGIKKMITEKISNTLEKKDKDKVSTLERENDRNEKRKNRMSEPVQNVGKQDKGTFRNSTEVQMIETNVSHPEMHQAEVQKKENDPKRGMKFGIRVLPPNVPDDGVIKKNVENGDVNDIKSIDEPDKSARTEIKHENEIDKKPVVAKRRDKTAPPVPNVRTLIKPIDIESDNSYNSKVSEQSTMSTFLRDDLNSSGIKRDENGIPQELPSQMFEAAMYARNNRKSVPDLDESERDEVVKPKKTKGKAPSPPEEKNKTDDSMVIEMKDVDYFLNNEKLHSSSLLDSKVNTSTPKNKSKQFEESINFSQDDIDDIVTKPFRKESDSLNNYYEDTKSNMSSNLDVHSVVSLNNSDKGSTTIELHNSDITIHSSPANDTLQSISDEASILEENERKATSLGDLSRFENRGNRKPSQGTLERAQSLDISADDVEAELVKSPKRKAKSVVESTFFESSNVENLPELIESETIVIKSKEPRLSLNIAKTSAMEGLSTFQRNRLKKASEFGNLEDAIVKGSDSSLESEKMESNLHKNKDYGLNIHDQDSDISKLGKTIDKDEEETSDHHAKKIMDENMRIHFKLMSEFAKTTSDNSNYSSMEIEPNSEALYTAQPVTTDFPNSLSLTYDTNIPDDVKVSRHTLVNSLERPKSEMMKKLLAKNPAVNANIDQIKDEVNAQKTVSHQPDVVNFSVQSPETNPNVDDFISNIRIGSNNNSLTFNKGKFDTAWTEKPSNVVTINAERIESPNDSPKAIHTKSIEIGKTIPDVIEGAGRATKSIENNTKTYFNKEPTFEHYEMTVSEEPIQKTVTVNVAEDEFGNKVITQNVEEISTKYINETAEAPLQIEQVTFGLIKNPKDTERIAMEGGENVKEIDRKVLEDIKKQNPNLHFTTEEPAYSKTETIILKTNLDEADALALMDKLKNDPTFMSQKTPEELSEMGVRVIHDLEDKKEEDKRHVEVTKTRYTIDTAKITTDECTSPVETRRLSIEPKDNSNHVTEIQVLSPKTEKLLKEKSENKETFSKNKNAESEFSNDNSLKKISHKENSYILDISLLNDFITNERHHTSMELASKPKTKFHSETHKPSDPTKQEHSEQAKPKPTIEPRSPKSDFDLPRNTEIKFRTATYESPKGTIVTSTDLENKRLSQMDQESRIKPSVSAKPSNIPVKLPEKPSKQLVSPSKIPVFKSQSQENLTDKGLSLPKSPPKLGGSSGNISVTSIKSSSKNPSGKL